MGRLVSQRGLPQPKRGRPVIPSESALAEPRAGSGGWAASPPPRSLATLGMTRRVVEVPRATRRFSEVVDQNAGNLMRPGERAPREPAPVYRAPHWCFLPWRMSRLGKFTILSE